MFSSSRKGSARTRLDTSLPFRKRKKPHSDTPALLTQSTSLYTQGHSVSSSPPPLPPRIPLRPLTSPDACQSPVKRAYPKQSIGPLAARPQRKSSWSSLSQSITGSLRVRKRRSVNLKQELDKSLNVHPPNSQNNGGYFEAVNQSMSCLNHHSNGRDTLGNGLHKDYDKNTRRDFDISINLNRTDASAGLDTTGACEEDSGASIRSGTMRRSIRAFINLHGDVERVSGRKAAESSVKRNHLIMADGGNSKSRFIGFDTKRPVEGDLTTSTDNGELRRSKGACNLHCNVNVPSRKYKSHASKRRHLMSIDGESNDHHPSLSMCGEMRQNESGLKPEEKPILPYKLRRLLSRGANEDSFGPRPEPEGQSMSPPTKILAPKKEEGLVRMTSTLNNLDMTTTKFPNTHSYNLCEENSSNISVNWYNIDDSYCGSSASGAPDVPETLSMPSILEYPGDLSCLDLSSRSFRSVHERRDRQHFHATHASKLMDEIAERLNRTGVAHQRKAPYHSNSQSSSDECCVPGQRHWRQQGLNQTFTQGLSLAVGDDPNATNVKLLGACSVNNIACQTNDRGQGQKTGRVASWAVNFQNLLSDPVGIEIFTEFLQKEFSEENIIFWKACEQYRQLKDEQQRKLQAQDIYSRYLSNRASEPVNVDSAARSHTEQFLDSPTTIMFDVAQHQIFQLMRQDSYSRFIKSDLYKARVMDEMAGKPLEPPASSLANAAVDVARTDNGAQDKKKGKGKENEDKRRRSILPWRNVRKSIKNSTDAESKKASKKAKEEKEQREQEQNTNNVNNLNMSITSGGSTASGNANVGSGGSSAGNLKKAPGPGIDLSTMRKEVFHPKDSQEVPESQFKFCRIVMPDGSTTVVCAKPGQSTRYVLGKLCEKRSISLASVDVFLLGSDRLLDLNEDISHLGSKEIVIEPRVMFRLDMPSGKSIGVKAKPNRSIRDVFRPIMHKYGYRMESISVRLMTSQEFLDLDVAVSELDKQRAVIVCSNPDVADWVRRGGMPGPDMPPSAPNGGERPQSKGSAWRGGSLEEITNKIFEDLMRGKSQLAHGFDELGVLELDKPKANKNDEGRSLGLFGLLRKESMGARDNHKNNKTKGKVTFALPRSDSKKKNNAKEGERLFELLSSAQSLRLEEQRGIHVAPGELPSFLCEDKNQNHNNGQQNEFETLATQQQLFDDVIEISRAGILEKKAWRKSNNFQDNFTSNTPTPRHSASTPRGGKYGAKTMTLTPLPLHSDQSFSRDGVIPSPSEGEAFFRMSPMIVDSRLTTLGMSLDGALELRNGDKYPEPEVGRFGEIFGNNSSSRFNGRHAFQPLHSPPEQRRTKAPVASPEKFSPQKKKQRNSPENVLESNDINFTFAHTRSNLSTHSPSSMLPGPFNLLATSQQNSGLSSHHSVSPAYHGRSPQTTLSSSSSSKTPTPSLHNKSPSPHAMTVVSGSMSPHPAYGDGIPQTHSRPSSAINKNRLSDGMLIHKLQQAQRDRDTVTKDHKNQYLAQNLRSSSTHFTISSQAAKETNGSLPGAPSKSMEQHANLAQRALLSPRFDHGSPDRTRSSQQPVSSSIDMTQRALLSPRFDQISSRSGREKRDPSPYQMGTSSVPLSMLNQHTVAAALSPRYSESLPMRTGNPAGSTSARYTPTSTLPPSNLPVTSLRPQASVIQSFPSKHFPSSSSPVGEFQGEETVTFV